MGFVMRHGRRIEIIDRNEPDPEPKKRRKPFEPLFVKVPRHWVGGLGQSKSASTYQLALLILWEAFKQGTKEVVLSTAATGMPRETKGRAARELAELGLIRLKGKGTKALRATIL